jgi:hypothetical protein
LTWKSPFTNFAKSKTRFYRKKLSRFSQDSSETFRIEFRFLRVSQTFCESCDTIWNMDSRVQWFPLFFTKLLSLTHPCIP